MLNSFTIDSDGLIFVAVALPFAIWLAIYNLDSSWHKLMDKHLQMHLLVKHRSVPLPLLRICFLLLLSICLVQPSHTSYIKTPPCGMIALDLTLSMNQIMPSGLTKLQQAKLSLKQWIDNHAHYQLSLWVWSEDSYQIVPLTSDAAFIKYSLDWFGTDLLNQPNINAVQSMQRIAQHIRAECKPIEWLIVSDGIPSDQLIALQSVFNSNQNISVIDLTNQGLLSKKLQQTHHDIKMLTIDHAVASDLPKFNTKIEHSLNLHPTIPILLFICAVLWLIIGIGDKSSAPIISQFIIRLLTRSNANTATKNDNHYQS